MLIQHLYEFSLHKRLNKDEYFTKLNFLRFESDRNTAFKHLKDKQFSSCFSMLILNLKKKKIIKNFLKIFKQMKLNLLKTVYNKVQ
jgi:hypothetical protein